MAAFIALKIDILFGFYFVFLPLGARFGAI